MAIDQGIDPGHTAFMFASMALVQFMTPGLAFFYGGLVNKKNVLAMMMQSYVAMAVMTLLWFAFVFSLCFGDTWGFLGSPFTYANFKHVPMHGPLRRDGVEVSTGIPATLYAGYQCMFAIITPPLMSGAFADRIRFKPYVLFISAWLVAVYAPVCHWVWGGGWMGQMGIFDWAGGMVVHVSAGFSALASLAFVGLRFQGQDSEPSAASQEEPHNVPFVALGAAMLWFGWYGFNGGSSYLSNGPGMLATINSQFAAAAAAVVWLIMDYLGSEKKPGVVSFCVGAVAGLATVTPAAGYIQPSNAVFLGSLSAVWCWTCVQCSKKWIKFGFEDALDVWGVHGMGGFLGTVMLGLLADGSECANAQHASVECANPGTITRSPQQFMKQFAAATFVAFYSVVVTYFLLQLIGSFMCIVPTPEEQLALDEAEHGETAYVLQTEYKFEPLRFESTDGVFSKNVKIPFTSTESTTGSLEHALSFTSSHYDGEDDRSCPSRMPSKGNQVDSSAKYLAIE